MDAEPLDPAAALAAMQASRAQVAKSAAVCPPQRHALFGGILGVMTAGFALPEPWPIVVMVLALAVTGGVVARDRAKTGVFVNGYRAGRTRPLTFALLGVCLVILYSTMAMKLVWGWTWAPVIGGLAEAVIAYFASRLWSRIYLRELGAES